MSTFQTNLTKQMLLIQKVKLDFQKKKMAIKIIMKMIINFYNKIKLQIYNNKIKNKIMK